MESSSISKHHIPFFEKGFFADLFNMENEIHVTDDEDRLLLSQAIGELRLTLATQYVSDAIARRKIQEMPYKLSQRVAEYIYTHPWYSNTMFLCIFFLVLWSPYDESNGGNNYVSVYGSLVVICDVLLGMVALRSRYFASRSNKLVVLIILIVLINQLAIHSETLRGFRVFLLVLKSHGLRLTVGGMTKTLPRIWQVIVIYLTVTTFYALIAQEFLHSYYHELDVEFTDTFHSFPRAWLTMFVLSTTENFPFLVYPPLFRSGGMYRGYNGTGWDAAKPEEMRTLLHGLVVLFFVSYLVLLVYLVLNMKLAAIYDSWKEVHEEQLAKSRMHRFHAMLAAHAVLVDDGNRDIHLDKHWRPLLERVRPDLSDAQVMQLFKFIDHDGNSGVGLKEWILRGVDAITFSFSSSALDGDRFLAELAASAEEARADALVRSKAVREVNTLRASLSKIMEGRDSITSQQLPQSTKGVQGYGHSGHGAFSDAGSSIGNRPSILGGGGAYGYDGGLNGLTSRDHNGMHYGEDVTTDHFAPHLQATLAEAEAAAAKTGPRGDLILPPLYDVGVDLYIYIITMFDDISNESSFTTKIESRKSSSTKLPLKKGGGIVLVKQETRKFFNHTILSTNTWRWCTWLLVLVHSLLLILSTWPYNQVSSSVQWILVILFLSEEVIKHIGLPTWRLRSWPKRFDFVATLGLLGAELVPLFDHTHHHDCQQVTTGGCARRLKVQIVFRAIVILRFLTIGRGARDVIETVYRIRNILGLFVCVFFIIVYMSSSIALDLFKGVLPKDFVYDTDDDTGADDDVIAAQVNMDTFYNAALQLFQIATTNNWQDIMYANVLQGNAGPMHRTAMAAFFVLYFFTMVWFGTNVLTALVIDVYMVAGVRKTEAKKRRAMVAKSLVDQKKKENNPRNADARSAAANHQNGGVGISSLHATSTRMKGNVDGRCSRCALNGHTCPGASAAGTAIDGRVGLCKNCGHGMIYHTSIDDQDSDPSFPSNHSSKSNRKWGALRQMVKASKNFSSNQSMRSFHSSTSDHGQEVENNIYRSNKLKEPLLNAPIPEKQQQYHQQQEIDPRISREASAIRVVKKDQGALLQAGWLDLQAHSGLRVDDTVSAHATIDDDLIDPKILDQLRYSVSATCAKLQQRRKALHTVVIKRYGELKQEAARSTNLRDRLRSLGTNNGMNLNTDFSQY